MSIFERSCWLPAALMCLAAAGSAEAQRSEFVKQGLLVPSFTVAPGVPAGAGKRAGDAARSGARKRSNGREVEVTSSELIATTMAEAGYRPDEVWLEADIKALGTKARADEYLIGRVASDGRDGSPARVSGTLVLMRDARMRQPLVPVAAAKLDDAAEQLGHGAAAARAQLPHLRRCENALRDGAATAAAQAARAGIAAYPRASMARTCLVWALRAGGASPAEILAVAHDLVAIDSGSYHGLEAAAIALDSLRRHGESAPLWIRLARTDTADFDLTQRVLYVLHQNRSLDSAEALAVRVAAAHPDYLPFARHQWRIAYEANHWPVAIAAGEVLLARDAEALADPVFFRRMATTYRATAKPYKAIETVARGVAQFPGDAQLYSLYTQYIRVEADTVLPRGLALFPGNGELMALHAQQLRARGQLSDAVDAMRLAIAADASIPDAALMLAQTELELGRPDSALVSLRAALGGGGDSVRIAQFAFARGNAMYRAAQTTRRSSDYESGLGFLLLADSVRTSAQSQLLIGMTALGVAQSAFTEAVVDKDPVRRCGLVQRATSMLPLARASLALGRDVAAEAVEQGLAFLDQLEPYSVTAIKGFCGSAPVPGAGPG